MTTIATLAVKLIADAGGFTSALDTSASKARAWSTNVSKTMLAAGQSMQNVGRNATMFLTLPLVGAAVAAVNYASDLEETKNKVVVVFGEMSGSVMAWSQTSATAMGMSQNTALAAAGTFGNLFTTMGIGQDASADMSMGLVQLASDLASFNNMDPTEVLDKLRSGLVGEVEPLRTLGINLSQAAVAAKAMEMGLAGVDGTLTPAALAQARYALILEQSANSAGDFARTSEGLANQQRILKARFQDAAAALGGQLLPYALKFVEWVSGLIDKFQALTPEQQKWIIIIGAAVAAIGPLLMIVGGLVTAIGAIIPVVTAVAGVLSFPLIAIIAAVIAVIALLYLAWTNNWGGIQEKTAALWAWLQPILMQLWTWLSTNIPIALQTLANYWQTVLLPAIMAVWSFVSTVLWPLFVALVTFLGTVFGVAISVLAGVWQNVLLPVITAVWEFITNSLWPLFQVLVQFMGAVFGLAIRVLAGIWQNILLPVLTIVWDFVKGSLFPLFETLADFLGAVFGLAVRVLAGVWQNILQPALKGVWEWLEKIYKKVMGDVQPILEKLGVFLETVISGQLKSFREVLDAIRQSFTRISGAVQSVIQKIKEMIIWLESVDIPDWLGGGGGGSSGGGGGFSGGAPIPMAAGGDFLVTRPTLFLAGEAGPERAWFSGANNVNGSGAGNTYITVEPHYYRGDEPSLLEELKLIGALARAG